MSSWEGSACYPRSTFYPLSDGPSIRNRRITMLQFPACAACRPPSQAPLCHYTLRTVTNRPEGTFRSLRYAFGGDHPSQTTHQARSLQRKLVPKQPKGRISTAAPRQLTLPFLSLPPILDMQHRTPVPNWSKAPWGLSVLARVASIFTGTSISPDVLSRQRSNHYAFRAGRNLPDKEFRYLRTVIVTAAVYWGLNSKLRLR